MKLEINISKGKFWTLTTLLVLAISVFVFAATDKPNPGHGAGEVEGLIELQQKVDSLISEDEWPSGTYCIWKKGECPSGFTLASMTIDGEDDDDEGWNAGGPIGDSNADGKKNYNINACCK